MRYAVTLHNSTRVYYLVVVANLAQAFNLERHALNEIGVELCRLVGNGCVQGRS